MGGKLTSFLLLKSRVLLFIFASVAINACYFRQDIIGVHNKK